MKRFKQNPLRDIILIVAVAGLSIWIFKTCSGDERMASDLPTYKEVQEIKKQETESGKDFWQMQQRPTERLSSSGIPKSKYDSILAELGLKEKQVQSLTITSGTMQDSLKLTKIQLDQEKNKVWNWEKKLKSGSVLTRTMSEKDSVLHESSDIAVATVDRIEGNGKNKRFYTIFYPLDDNFKFNGASVFRKENKEIKDVLKVNIGAEFQKSFISPNSRIQTDLNLTFFPDGKFAPSAKVGAVYDLNQGLDLFYGARLDWNILRIKNQK